MRLSEKEFAKLQKQTQKLQQKSKSKHGNKKTVVDGFPFDSKFEAEHWVELKYRAAAGEIRNLRRQVTYEMVVNGFKVCSYRADFVYEERRPDGVWRRIVSDTKNPHTRRLADYRIKFKLMQALHGVTIREVMQVKKSRKKR